MKLAGLLKDTVAEWKADNASRLGAALAFYSLFSMAPLLIIVISITGLVFGRDAAQGRVLEQLQELVGREAARSIESIMGTAQTPAPGIIAAAVGIITLMVGASGVFHELQEALNVIWNAPPKPKQTILQMIKDRVLSFTMVLGTGFLLLISLVISAALAALNDSLAEMVAIPAAALQAVHIIVSFAVTTLMFAMIFKQLPDIKITWGDVWIGAAATSVLFTIGKALIGLYLGKTSVASAYGAAGSLVILLLWVYYSAQILFFGAEFTQVYANRHGSRPSPRRETRDPETQGITEKRGSPDREPANPKQKLHRTS